MTLIAKTYWAGAPYRFRERPADVDVEPVVLRAADRREIDALYWTARASRPRTAVVAMHPRVDFSWHYCFPGLLREHIACLGARTRHPNNDTDTVHEEIALDVGAAIAFLRERGIRHVVLLGNSGGGSLAALYQAEALRPPSERIATTPGGAPTRLPHVEMPPADAMIYVAAHLGQGRVLGECIDGSLVDEGELFATDPALDMYRAENGFRPPPEWSEYDAAFVERYRAAQRRRIERLDAMARAHIAAARDAEDPQRKHAEPVMLIYRTMASLHYVDKSLDPSARAYGSLLSDRPDLMNMAYLGFARTCTPRAWLSTWSAISSQADMLATVPRIPSPTLSISAGADREIYPQSHTLPLSLAIASDDRTVAEISDAGHYFEPELGADHRDRLVRLMVDWIADRFEVG